MLQAVYLVTNTTALELALALRCELFTLAT